jgi:hypothetical protein
LSFGKKNFRDPKIQGDAADKDPPQNDENLVLALQRLSVFRPNHTADLVADESAVLPAAAI